MVSAVRQLPLAGDGRCTREGAPRTRYAQPERVSASLIAINEFQPYLVAI